MNSHLPTQREDVAERVERTARRTRQGESAREISYDLGVTQRSIERYRAKARRVGLLPQT